METEKKLYLAYWSARGRGSYVRYTLEAAGIEYDERRYAFTEKDQWFQVDKPNSSLLLPNLPHMIYGDIKISETDALCRQIARLFNLNCLANPMKIKL